MVGAAVGAPVILVGLNVGFDVGPSPAGGRVPEGGNTEGGKRPLSGVGPEVGIWVGLKLGNGLGGSIHGPQYPRSGEGKRGEIHTHAISVVCLYFPVLTKG